MAAVGNGENRGRSKGGLRGLSAHRRFLREAGEGICWGWATLQRPGKTTTFSMGRTRGQRPPGRMLGRVETEGVGQQLRQITGEKRYVSEKRLT